ncbi:GNAT family N-acetyltransferase [Shewanella maritima]|uniref:GNAT family N-acetyltransferase n=1 Tax=Shewanella maritima TaxID=2520507 RepID=UPI003735ECC7
MKELTSPMDYQFTTERLSMRLMEQQDFDVFQRLYSDPKTMRKICPPLAESKIHSAFEKALSNNQQPIKRQWIWAISHQHKIIGLQSLMAQSTKPDFADIGMMLLRTANGKMFAEEATTGLVEMGFNRLKFKRIYAHYDATNLATHRITRKLGFVFKKDIHAQSKPAIDDKEISCYLQQKND